MGVMHLYVQGDKVAMADGGQDQALITNWFDEMPMLGMVLVLWIALGAVSYVTVFVAE
jgi:hypothetical protein